MATIALLVALYGLLAAIALLYMAWRQVDPRLRGHLSPFNRAVHGRYQAVLGGLTALRDDIAKAGSFQVGGADLTRIRTEVADLLSLLPSNGRPTTPPMLERGDPAAGRADIVAELSSLIRAVHTRGETLVGARARAASATTARSAGGGVAAAAVEAGGQSAPDVASGLDENLQSALLLSLTEKFYASPAFKGLAAVIILSFSIALGGTFILAQKSYNINDALDKKYDEAVARIDKIELKAEQRNKSADDVINGVNTRLIESARSVDKAARDALIQMADQRDKLLKNLKEDTVKDVVSKLQEELKTRRGEIDAAFDNDIKPKITQLTSDVRTQEQRLTTASTQIGEVIRTMPPAKDVATMVTAITTAVQTSSSQASAAQAAARDAGAFRDAATTQAAASEKSRDAVAAFAAAAVAFRDQTESLRDETTRIRDDTKAIHDDMKKAVAAPAPGNLDGRLDAIQRSVIDLDEQLGDLTTRVADLEQRLNKPTLNDAQVCAVQLRLNQLGFPAGGVDGKPGQMTLGAIRTWQASKGVLADGILTSQQLADLIGQAPAPPCPPPSKRAPRRQ